jgi:hypothetical protein
MNSGSQSGHTTTGSQPPRRQTPEHAQRERRKALWAGLLGVAMGLGGLWLGVDGMRTGQWIAMGRRGSEVLLPGWIVVLMAIFLLFIGASVMWRFGRKT